MLRILPLLACLCAAWVFPSEAFAASRRPPRPTLGVAEAPLPWDGDDLPETTPVERGHEGGIEGVPVLTNGRITVAAARKGFLLLSHDSANRPTVRARWTLVGNGGDAEAFQEAAVEEYGRTRLAVRMRWRRKEERLEAILSIRRGHVTCEVTPGEGAAAIRMHGPEPEAVIVPAFYGDDFLFDPADAETGAAFVPSEFLALWPVGDGEALVQAVWNPAGPDGATGATTMVEVRVAEKKGRNVIASTSLTFAGKSLYLAAWEAEGLWAKVPVDARFATDGKTRDVRLPWRPPYSAKWQAIVHGPGQYTSWTMKGRRHKGRIGPHGREVYYTWPFWREKKAYWLHLPPGTIQTAPPDYVLIYPLQRDKRTPAHVKLPDDILKESLKTGVCEHLFQSGGGGNPGGPLCALIRRFTILARLYADTGRSSDLLAAHARWIYEQGEWQYRRLREYRAFGATVAAKCVEARETHPELAATLSRLEAQAGEIVKACDKTLDEGAALPRSFRDFEPESDDPVEAMAEIHERLKAALAKKCPENLAQWKDLAHKLHRMAVRPQGALPRPRALTRLIQNQATRLAVTSPAAARFSAGIRGLAQEALRGRHWAEQGR